MMVDADIETFPQLETKNLMLRKLVPADAEAIFRIFADDEVTRSYDLETFTKVEQAIILIERQTQRLEENKGVRWGIARKSNNIIIGTCGYVWKPNFRAVLGYELARPFWRQGIMTEALSAVVEFGFTRLSLNRIEALVMMGNVASAHLLRKLGFHEEGTLREYAFFKGQFHDLHCFSILKKDYHRR